MHGKFCRIAIEHNVAVHHLKRARCTPGDTHIMSNEDERHVPVPVKRREKIEDMFCALGVQVTGWLVGQKHGRKIGHASGDGDTLTFAARKFGGEMIYPLLEPD